MRKQCFAYSGRIAMTLTVATALAQPVFADAISPSIGDTGKVYSTEKPNTSYYGTGTTAKLQEASELRFEGDRLMSDGKLDEAVKVFAKAVQFDPQDPGGHIMLARAMTTKLKSNRENFDWELYGQVLDEWNLIAKHDADHLEQLEARNAMANLKRLAKEKIAQKQGKKQKRSMLAGLNPLSRFK